MTVSCLQKIKHAKSLLKNVELENQLQFVKPSDSSGKRRPDSIVNREWAFDYDDVRKRLGTLEDVVSELNKVHHGVSRRFFVPDTGSPQKCTPTPRKPPPILPLMPQPVDEPEKVTSGPPPPPYEEGQESYGKVEDSVTPGPTLSPSKELSITDDLLTAPSEKLPPPTSPSRRVPLSTAAAHEELSAQLAQMATQLKRNAIHFSDTLVRDQAVVEEANLKMESNYDSMLKERTRLRDHSGKSRGTTWLTLFSIIAVFVSFLIMFFIIRLTR